MGKVEFKFNKDVLNKIEAELKKEITVAIGVLRNSKHPDSDQGIATIAAVHEFGSRDKKIPQRSFLRLTLVRRQKDFSKFLKEKEEKILKQIAQGQLKNVFEKLGAWWVSAVHDTFDAQGYGKWKDLKDTPYKKWREKKGNKGGKTYKILMVTGALRRSIIYKVITK